MLKEIVTFKFLTRAANQIFATAIIIAVIIVTGVRASEPQLVPLLSVRTEGKVAVITWASDVRESFAVLWRSNTEAQRIRMKTLCHSTMETRKRTFSNRELNC